MNRASTILRTVMTVGVFAAVIVAPTQFSFEVARKTYLSLADPVIWGTFGIWVGYVLVSRQAGAVRSIPLFHALFAGAVLLSLIGAEDRTAVWKELFQVVEYFIVGTLLFVCGIQGERRLRGIVFVFFGAGTALVAWAWIQYATPSVPSFTVCAGFGNRNVLGGYLSLLLPLMYGVALCAGGWRRIWLGLTVAAGTGVVLSGGALVALLVSMGVVSALRGWKILAGYLVVAMVLAGVILPILPRGNTEEAVRSIAAYNPDGQLNRRYMEWDAGMGMARANPWVGVGAGNYQRNIGGYYGTIPVPAGRPSEPDSQMMYLVLAASLGWPGMLCFAGMLLTAGATGVRRYVTAVDGFRRGLLLGVAGSVTAFAVNCVWSPLLVRGIGLPLSLILALPLCVEAIGRKGEERAGVAEGPA